MGKTSSETIVFREANYLSWRLLINENVDVSIVYFQVLHIAKGYLLPPREFQTRVFGLYLLYGLYNEQLTLESKFMPVL